MSGNQDHGGDALRDWDAYWRNAGLAPALRDGGPQDEALDRFWSDFLDQAIARAGAPPRMLDIASGNGAVVRFALRSAERRRGASDLDITGLDSSPAALAELRRRHTAIRCVVADATRTPFRDRAFDIVTSQFGLEYAGPGAIAEAARLVAPGGLLAAVLHLRDGGIYKECAVNLEAVDGFRKSGLLPRFDAAYRAAWAVNRSGAPAEVFREAERSLSAAVMAAREILARFGQGIATGILYRLYSDIGRMHERMGAYDPEEMTAWLKAMVSELESYSGRMASMLHAAFDAGRIAQATRDLVASGLGIRLGGILKFGRPPEPCAWAIVARRPGDPVRDGALAPGAAAATPAPS
jgi:ubiquinone/menaquinone biosynthesis C-methylase UbiE